MFLPRVQAIGNHRRSYRFDKLAHRSALLQVSRNKDTLKETSL